MNTHYGELDTAWLRVLYRLWTCKREGERFNLEQMVAGGEWITGWLPNYVFTSPMIGGTEGLRRLRYIREELQVPVDHKVHTYEYHGEAKRVNIYRLGCNPAQVDFREVMRLRSDYRFPVEELINTQTELL